MNDAQRHPEIRARWWFLPLFLAAIISVWWLAGALIANLPNLPDWTHRARFGDMFGAVGALFSGFAFAGIVYAILLQHQELVETRRELARNAAAQEDTSRQMTEQVKLLASTARITALSSLVTHLDERLKRVTPRPGMPREEAFQDLPQLIGQLKQELERLDQFFAEGPNARVRSEERT